MDNNTNENKILEIFKKTPYYAFSRLELMAITGFPRTTIHDALRRLVTRGIVERSTIKTFRSGRQIVCYYLCQ